MAVYWSGETASGAGRSVTGDRATSSESDPEEYCGPSGCAGRYLEEQGQVRLDPAVQTLLRVLWREPDAVRRAMVS